MTNYLLGGEDGRTPVPCDDLMTWARSLPPDRRVALSVGWFYRVSTVFLGIDHNFYDEGPPLLFETLAETREGDEIIERCSTWAQAEAQHARVLAEVRRRGRSWCAWWRVFGRWLARK